MGRLRSWAVYNRKMRNFAFPIFLSCSLLISCGSNKGNVASAPSSNTSNAGIENSTNSGSGRTVPTPSNKLTKDDIAKLKWIEGTWQGMDGDKPFFERYKLEETTMIVETLKEDGKVDGEPGRFELANGEFGTGEGERRSAASEIGEEFVQFVPGIASKGNSYRFERKGPNVWHAILEWPAVDGKPARQKVYVMERFGPRSE
jgi:hypothetical protein